MKIEAYGWIKDGILQIANRKRMEADLKGFKDCDVVIIIKKRGKRSSQANRYYWGIVIDELRREFARRGERFKPETIHEALKAKFNPARLADDQGEPLLEIGTSTTEMNGAEFGEYIERICEWAALKLQLTIPPPNTQSSMFPNLTAA